MKKLNLAIAITLCLSVMPVQATDISGIAGNNGIYNITPEKIKGDVGFRQYENFNLSKGDIANLIFNKATNGQNDKLESFVNLVNNKVDINGILNTVQNGKYYNGDVVFITPNGFTVGSSGVLNVGSLSVGTPTTTTYNKLLNYYEKGGLSLQRINNQINDLVLNTKGNAGAADITIQGKVLARNGINMAGKNVDISGTVINGVATYDPSHWHFNDDYDVVISSNEQAEQLFRSLVNTTGLRGMMPLVQGDDEEFINKYGNNGSDVYIKSTNSMNISGVVDNGDGSLYFTNNGNNGLTVTGTMDSTKEAKLLNTSGDLKVDGNAAIQGRYTGVNITNSGNNLTLGENTKVESVKNIEVTNNGSGKLTALGKLLSGNEINNTEISNINITNNGSGMKIGGLVVNSDESAYPHIHQDMHEPGNGNINITNNKGDLALDARIINYDGDTKINNYGKGAMSVDGSIYNNRNIEIVNKNGSSMTVNGNIENYNSDINAGNLKIVNHSGSGLTIGENATIKNEGGKLYIQNKSGLLNINGKLSNYGELTNHGYNLNIVSKGNSDGIITGANSLIINEGTGNIAITHKGSGNQGINLNGSITNKAIDQDQIGTTYDVGGKIVINNYASGNMNVNGKISAIGNLDIINRENGADMNVNADIVTNGENIKTNIGHYGTGAMTVNGNIKNNNGTLKIANHSGSGMTIGGDAKIKNHGKLYVYNESGLLNINGYLSNVGDNLSIVSKGNSDGIRTRSDSQIINDSAGNIVITQKGSGNQGMNLNGNITSIINDGKISINNYSTGNMNVNGIIQTTGDLDIINRENGADMNVKADINTLLSTPTPYANRTIKNLGTGNMNVNNAIHIDGGKLNIVNGKNAADMNVNVGIIVKGKNIQTNIEHNGKGNMTVDGKIAHYGRLNIIDNNGQLKLNGKIVNNGTDMTYAVSQKQGTGIDVTNTFSATAKNGGKVLIKNVSGANGLNFAGNIESTGLAELNNQKGNLILSGTIKGNPTVIRNTGDNLIMKSKTDLKKEAKTVNNDEILNLKKAIK